MKPSFILFVVVVILGFVAGFYYHEGLNEKVQYERDTCYSQMNQRNIYRNINNYSDVVIYGTKK